jgi:hypothetical protein
MDAEIVGDDEAAMRLGCLEEPLAQLRLRPERPALPEQPLDEGCLLDQRSPTARLVGHEMLALTRHIEVDPLLLCQIADERDGGFLQGEVALYLFKTVALGHDPVAELCATEAAKAAIAA